MQIKPNLLSVKHQAYLLLTLATLFWSGNFVLARAMSTSIPPITMAYWRWQVAMTILLPFAIWGLWKHRKVIRANLFRLIVLSVVGVAFFNTFVYLGLQTTTATNALLINSAIPILIILLAITFIREPVTRGNKLGVVLSLIGVVFLILRGDLRQLMALDFVIGDFWVLAAALSWAVYSLLLKRWKPNDLPAASFLMFSVAVGAIALGLLYWPNLPQEPSISWGTNEIISVIYFALFPSLASYICWNEGVAKIGAASAGHFIHLMPLFGVTLSIIFLGENIEPYHLVGAGFIAAGIWLAIK